MSDFFVIAGLGLWSGFACMRLTLNAVQTARRGREDEAGFHFEAQTG